MGINAMKSLALTCALALAASTAVAQTPAQPYARIISVDGLVTVTSGNQLSNATSGMSLSQGAQVLTTGNGTVTIQFANGCTATLRPGQSLAVQESECARFLAMAATPAAPAIGGATVVQVLLGVAGLGLLINATAGGTAVSGS